MPRLAVIDLRNSEVTDQHLDDLRVCKRLRRIDLRETHVTSAGVARLQKALPNCEIRWQD
jgi:hypothetical protein